MKERETRLVRIYNKNALRKTKQEKYSSWERRRKKKRETQTYLATTNRGISEREGNCERNVKFSKRRPKVHKKL